MLNLWQELAVKEGIPGLYIVSQHSTYAISNKKNEHINAKILYEPGYTQAESVWYEIKIYLVHLFTTLNCVFK